jgi:hypothetical protein
MARGASSPASAPQACSTDSSEVNVDVADIDLYAEAATGGRYDCKREDPRDRT